MLGFSSGALVQQGAFGVGLGVQAGVPMDNATERLVREARNAYETAISAKGGTYCNLTSLDIITTFKEELQRDINIWLADIKV